jgi:dTDP-4-amino-4,6-dideoxygalactose transaminase
MHGQMANMDEICAFAKKHQLMVIEDAAQAHDAYYKGKHAGTMGDLGCFSFYPTKNLGACGEGGMIVTNNPEFAEKVRLLRDWGQTEKYNHVYKGYNFRMDGIQAAILDVKLKHLKQWTQLRREQAAIYDAAFEETDFLLPAHQENCTHSYHVYSICSRQRNVLRDELQNRGIATALHYAKPVHFQPAFANLDYARGSLPVSEHLSSLFLSLPIYAELSLEQAQTVADNVLAILEEQMCVV